MHDLRKLKRCLTLHAYETVVADSQNNNIKNRINGIIWAF